MLEAVWGRVVELMRQEGKGAITYNAVCEIIRKLNAEVGSKGKTT